MERIYLVGKICFQHEVISPNSVIGDDLMPHCHQVISLLKRWLLGTHQGAVRHKHLDYYLDEYTFRFNRRKSNHRGKLFYRLIQNAVHVSPITRQQIIEQSNKI